MLILGATGWARVMRWALPLYAAAMLAVGAASAWRAPLAWDENRFYLPAIKDVASQLPRVPLQYALPQPPAMLLVQAAVWRVSGSVALLRALATVAFIATVWLAARIVAPRNAPSALLVAMFAVFPAMLANAYSLKQHAFTLLFLTAALLMWRRRRAGWAAVFLALAMLTHQLALAFGLTLGLLALGRLWRERSRDAWRDVLLLALAAAPYAVLVVLWRGLQPPAFIATHPDVAPPQISPPQMMLALVMLGFWLEPLVAEWKRAVIMTLLLAPAGAALMHASGIAGPFGDKLDGRAAGPVMSVIRSVAPVVWVWVVAAGTLAAAGVMFFRDARSSEARLYVAVCMLALLPVPFYFESYYALLICIAWLLLAEVIAARPPRLVVPVQCAYVLFGAAYGAAKLL